MKLSKKSLSLLIENYLYEQADTASEESQDPGDSDEEIVLDEIDDLEFDIDNKHYTVAKTEDGGYDVEVTSGGNEVFKMSSKEVGNQIKDKLGEWVSGAIEFKKNNPTADISKEHIQKWVDHIGSDLINRKNLVAFRSFNQNLSKSLV
mgnify:CR=1 FL=1|tara:strand:- start:75 stop:518 length:444 start_codon:yes stop_codon:yes gene_type:complete